MKIVINRCFGGFNLSQAAQKLYYELQSSDPGEWSERFGAYEHFQPWDIDRTDQYLVQVVEQLGETSWGRYSELKVVVVPDDVDWYTSDYDGIETVHEQHRQWG
jgi:hypothetical protein